MVKTKMDKSKTGFKVQENFIYLATWTIFFINWTFFEDWTENLECLENSQYTGPWENSLPRSLIQDIQQNNFYTVLLKQFNLELVKQVGCAVG